MHAIQGLTACTYTVYNICIYAIDNAFELPDLTLCYAEDKTRTLKWLWSMAWERERERAPFL